MRAIYSDRKHEEKWLQTNDKFQFYWQNSLQSSETVWINEVRTIGNEFHSFQMNISVFVNVLHNCEHLFAVCAKFFGLTFTELHQY